MAKKKLPQQLRICIVSRKFPVPGKTATGFLWPIAKGLAQKGHVVTVLTGESPQHLPELVQDGVHIFYLYENQRFFETAAFHKTAKKKFSELHRTQPFHLVHSIDSSGRDIARFKEEFNVSVAFDVEATQMAQLFSIVGMEQETVGSILKTYFALLYKFLRTFYGRDRRLLKTADAIFVTSPQQRIVLERYYLYPDARIYTVPYGMEIGDLTPRDSAVDLKKALSLPEDAKTVVAFSDMVEVGEIRALLRAFCDVAIKHSAARMVILGNGPKRMDIEAEMLSLALGNRVLMPGAISDREAADFVSVADVYVNLSSRTTGFEPSMLEAMAQRKVIIGSEVSAISSILEDGVDGFLVRPADVESLSLLLNQIFTGQIPVAEIGDRARRKVTNLLDVQKMVDETVNAYFKILRQTQRF